MSYSDDEELKIGNSLEEDEDDIDGDIKDPLLEGDLLPDDEEESEEFAGLDGSVY